MQFSICIVIFSRNIGVSNWLLDFLPPHMFRKPLKLSILLLGFTVVGAKATSKQ